jgi:flagellar biosynthesis component FlhA
MQALEYAVSIGGTACLSGKANLDARLVELHPGCATAMGLEVLREEKHPLTGHYAFWVASNAAAERVLTAGVLRSWDWLEHCLLQAAVFCQRHPEELFTMSDALQRIKELERKHPGLVSEGLDTEFVTTARLTEILQELVREGVSIKNFRAVVEAIASYCSSYGLSLVQQNEFDLHDIIGFVRLQRKRQLLSSRLSYRNTLRAITLSDEVEEQFTDASYEGNDVPLGIDRQAYMALQEGLLNVIEPVLQRGVLPVAVLCQPELRHKICSFLRFSNLMIASVTHDELEPQHVVEVLGQWK